MSRRAVQSGTPSPRPLLRQVRVRPVRVSAITLGALVGVALASAACGEEPLKHVVETYEIVGGEPKVDPSLPTVQRGSGTAKPSDFASSSPVQVDTFLQKQVAKVDILWVIDDSGSMKPKQDKVKANFQSFIAKLVQDNAQLDYHIGVITTDTFDPAKSGRLLNVKTGTPLSRPWIGKDTCVAPGCDPTAKFRDLSSVGIAGSGDEKGLLAASMALSPPLSTAGGSNAGFLRDDAALFVIVLSDEEDSSCAPVNDGLGGGCTAHRLPDGSFGLDYGEVDYYSRFFEGLKGYGRRDFVTVGVIVAKDQNSLANTNAQSARTGCVASSSEYAFFAPRYMEVARRTGGLATSICDANYSTALQNLGFLATGAKTTFLLSRAPYVDQIKVFVTVPGGQRTLQVAGRDYTYQKCTGTSTPYNAIEFALSSIPPASASIEVEYPVNVRGVTCP